MTLLDLPANLVEEALDVYLKEMTAEQQSYFESWLDDSLAAGLFPKEPNAECLRTVIVSWLGGWKASHMNIVEGVHDL